MSEGCKDITIASVAAVSLIIIIQGILSGSFKY